MVQYRIPVQAPLRPDDASIVTALVISTLFALAVILGYSIMIRFEPIKAGSNLANALIGTDNRLRVNIFLFLATTTSVLIAFDYGFDGTVYLKREYGVGMTERVGRGWYFVLAEASSLALIASAGYLTTARFNWRTQLPTLVLASVCALSSFLTLIVFQTRRGAAYVALLICIAVALKTPRLRLVIPLAMIAMVFGAPVLQDLRERCLFCEVFNYEKRGQPTIAEAPGNADPSGSVVSVPVITTSSSFEGVDHFAIWLQRTDWNQKLTGIDQGASWTYNSFLSMIPRTLWAEKPMVYGSLEEQRFLYPEMFISPYYATLPPSFVVDFSYGFGIPFGLFLALALGGGLRWTDRHLYGETNPFARAVALFVFMNVFNIVRSGTGFLQVLSIFSVACFVLFVKLPKTRILARSSPSMVGQQGLERKQL
ncbi:hypothetical protein OOZ54_07090 [Rhodopseudomonas palustris]|uniref:hypothetical protein n=1 Tax=Rhodopseudomonas palustris TaxID=1076 RepID=UPI0022F13F90|nr:hypothetical protein [Rhodopseudomonas palustris]WBU31254.1 hypothetical protein OOZ54_07090 [Rhodopseudomonas palustris]